MMGGTDSIRVGKPNETGTQSNRARAFFAGRRNDKTEKSRSAGCYGSNSLAQREKGKKSLSLAGFGKEKSGPGGENAAADLYAK